MSEIYLVEDDALIREHWAKALRERGHWVFAYAEGEPALDDFRRASAPSLMIVDLGLPGMAGAEVIREARREHSRANLPIIVVSGSFDEDSINEAFREGADDYLVKPVTVAELLAKVTIALRQSRRIQRVPFSSEFFPGDVAFGRWRVDEVLGKGSYGTVYGARCIKSDEACALKVLRGRSTPDRSRFLRECYTLGGLQHPGIVSVTGYGHEGDLYYLAMERVEGMDLAGAVSGGPLDEVSTLTILLGLARVLSVLSSVGVVHRDIKPNNVMLRRGQVEKPVLIDFGLAKYSGLGSGLTSPEFVMGTPGYMAPEVIAGAEPDPRSDVFALGVLGRYLLTGKEVYSTLQGVALLRRMSSDPVDMRIGASAALETLLEDMTRMTPAGRIPGEVLERRLERLLLTRGCRPARRVTARGPSAGDLSRSEAVSLLR